MNRSRLLVLASLLVAACGVDIVGTGAAFDAGATADAEAPDGSGPSDGEAAETSTPDDGGTGVDAEAGASDACAGSCPALDPVTAADAGPAFFIAALFDPATPCPSGYHTTDAIEKPTAPANACSCGNCTGQGGTCDNNGTVQLKHGDGTVCDANGDPISMARGTCQFPGIGFSHKLESASVSTTPIATGTCSVVTNAADKSKVTAVTKHRLCTPVQCGEQVCDLSAPQICLGALGDVACPAAFPKKTTLGTDFDVTCSSCTCAPQTTCGGTLSMFSNSNCTGTKQDLVANTCTTSPSSCQSYSYAVTTTTTCSTTSPGTPTVTLNGAVGTLCCPN